jgi:hypothetical protein
LHLLIIQIVVLFIEKTGREEHFIEEEEEKDFEISQTTIINKFY